MIPSNGELDENFRECEEAGWDSEEKMMILLEILILLVTHGKVASVNSRIPGRKP